jgi:arylsulfatase A-like enzyme
MVTLRANRIREFDSARRAGLRGGMLVRVLILLVSVLVSSHAQVAGRRPNIIFILTDDQGYGDISAHGNPVLKTPNLDRLHAEGARFTDFHVSPTCAPTRSALLTGRHEFRNGVTHTIHERERLAPSAIALPQVLKAAGYSTGIFGKWHLGDEPAYWPSARGFDEMFIHGAGGIGQSYPGSCGDAPGNKYFDPVILHNGRFEKTQGYCTDVFFEQAIKWIAQKKGGTPFFCYISTNAPHAPLEVSAVDEARHYGQPRDVGKFFGMISNIDDNVGRLLARLTELGIDKETLVIFMNDNGGTVGTKVFNDGMRGGKVTPWLGGTRAASLWRWPGTLAPGNRPHLTAHVDFFPTLAEIAGAKLDDATKQQVEGRSLVPLLEKADTRWEERTLFTHVGRWEKGAEPATAKYAGCAVRTPRWHLVSLPGAKEPGDVARWQLFDVQADKAEKVNVAAENPQILAALSGEYEKWWTSVQPQLVNEKVTGPTVNPFRELYWKQFGGGPEK